MAASAAHTTLNDVAEKFFNNAETMDLSSQTGVNLLFDTIYELSNPNTTHSFEEHTQVMAMAQEVSFLLTQNVTETTELTNNQVDQLIKFGTAFEISEKEYWRLAQEQLVKILESNQNLQNQQVFANVSALRQLGFLNSKILRATVEKLDHHIEVMPVQDLVTFTMMYSSPEMKQAVQIDNYLVDRLETTLIRKLKEGELNAEDVAMVCNAVGLTDNDDTEKSFELIKFTEAIGDQVLEWMQDNQFNLDMIVYVLAAFIRYQHVIKLPGADNTLFEAAEQTILRQGQFLEDPAQAIQIATLMAPYASAQLLEVLDRIIGRNVHHLQADQVVQALYAFCSANIDSVRPKIKTLLFRKVVDVLDELSIDSLCNVVGFFASQSKSARNDQMLKMIEPYINNRMNGMSEKNLLAAIKGYYAFGDPRYETLVALELMLMDNLHHISTEFVSEILYYYAKNKIGQRIMINKLLDRLRSDADSNSVQQGSVHLKAQIISTLYDCGADSENAEAIKKIWKSIDQSQAEQLSTEEQFMLKDLAERMELEALPLYSS